MRFLCLCDLFQGNQIQQNLQESILNPRSVPQIHKSHNYPYIYIYIYIHIHIQRCICYGPAFPIWLWPLAIIYSYTSSILEQDRYIWVAIVRPTVWAQELVGTFVPKLRAWLEAIVKAGTPGTQGLANSAKNVYAVYVFLYIYIYLYVCMYTIYIYIYV